MIKWEYNQTPAADFARYNKMGEDGWELIHIELGTAHWKRSKNQERTDVGFVDMRDPIMVLLAERKRKEHSNEVL